MYGTVPPNSPIDATMCPYPSFTSFDAAGSNRVTKSPFPPMNAPDIEAKSTEVSMFVSVLLIPFLLMAYSRVIAGIPPSLPPRIFLPFRSSTVKFLMFSLDTRKLPSFLVRPAKFTR